MAGKADLVDAIADQTGLSKKQASDVLEALSGTMTKLLKKEERIQFPSLGSFQVARRKARTGINPKTKEPIQIKASKTVKFKIGKELRDQIN